MRLFLVCALSLFALVGNAETYGNALAHWFVLESPDVRTGDTLRWSDTLGPERAAVFMSGSGRVSFEEYCSLIGWDDWLPAFLEDRATDLARQKKTSELVLSAASGAFAAVSYGSNPPLGLTLSALSVWALVHGLWGLPEADRPLRSAPRTWNDLIEASQ